MYPKIKGITNAPNAAKVLCIPEILPATSVPKTLGMIVNAGLLTKLMNHPIRNTDVYVTKIDKLPEKTRIITPKNPKLANNTFRSPTISDVAPPKGLAKIPAMLKRDIAVLVINILNLNSSFIIRGNQAMKV